jgi:ABC-type multidrug transport system ATPase subunit
MITVNIKSKEFDGFRVLENISFEVNRGDTLLILGPNGAGKTTLFRCIIGLLKFNGDINIKGLNVKSHYKEIKKIIGYVPQSINFPENMTARQLIVFHSKIHECNIDEEKLLREFDLNDVSDVAINEFSGGMKQRLALALAISHNPEILIFDEPLANLDSEGKKIFIKILKEGKINNKTILISSHRISDFLAYINKVLILNEGKSIYYGSLEELIKNITDIKIYIKLKKDIGNISISKGKILERVNDWLIVNTTNVLETLNELKKYTNIESMFIEEPSLDRFFMVLNRGDKNVDNA